MGAPPAVSVVIPTYDRAAVLPRAIDSVLGQTVEDLELLVVDDGSTDRAPDVVAGYADDRVRCLRHEQNRGASAARNSGIEAASGDYVAFLDSDDEWLAGKLETQLAVLEAASCRAASRSWSASTSTAVAIPGVPSDTKYTFPPAVSPGPA